MLFDGEQVAELPASLDGMYLSGAGRGAFWPAGEVSDVTAGKHEVTVAGRGPGRPRRDRSTPGASCGWAT